MGRPAGAQIRRWFVFLVGILIAVNLVSVAGSLAISRSVRKVADEAEPLAASTAFIQREILAAQRDLFQYLSEFSDTSVSALGHLDAVTRKVAELRDPTLAPELGAELDAIQKATDQYRKVLELLPRTAQGSRDWTRLQEYSATMVQLGKAVEERALRLTQAAQEEIRRSSKAATRVARGALWTSVGVLMLSALSVLALQHWWKRFQDEILGM